MSTHFIDLTGRQYSRLYVERRAAERGPAGQILWHVLCACGKRLLSRGCALRVGDATSCGCKQKDENRIRATKHGCYINAPELVDIWDAMMQRCFNQKHKDYERYGGRGITVCQRWLQKENFVADVSPRPSKSHSLDRKDNNGPYSPENCQWSTKQEQNRNNRRNVLLTAHDETKSIAEWAEDTGLPGTVIRQRHNFGWADEEAVDTPLGAPASHKAVFKSEQARLKYQAHRAVANAIARGDMQRAEACQRCKSNAKTIAHHYDYSRPLDVEWLCRRCHSKHHRRSTLPFYVRRHLKRDAEYEALETAA